MAELRVKSTGTIKLFESDNTSNVTIASPASLGADRTITLPDASVTLASGTMLATDGSGASLTALNASELGSGTVPTARLGSGTASSSTVLYGDQTYKTAAGWAYNATDALRMLPSESLATADFNVSAGWVAVDNFDVTHQGVWQVLINWRLYYDDFGTYGKWGLGTATGSIFTNYRLIGQNIGQYGAFANIPLSQIYYIGCGNDQTYPLTIYINYYSPEAGSTTLQSQNDASGVATINVLKVRDYDTSGVAQYGL